MPKMSLAAPAALAALYAISPGVACAAPDGADEPQIIVTADSISGLENAPSTSASIDAAKIATTVNAVSIEDALKYAPSLVIRKRSIGDNFAPIATRTSGLGSSARSLIYADGALLSALVANNNGNGSPKWNLVAPEEVARIDVLYGPFSAAYSGNSIGTVVTITTRTPDRFEANATVLFNHQWHTQYATSLALPTGQASLSIGDRFGRFAFFASETHTVSNGQPIVYPTATTAPAGTTGAIATVNRLGAPIQVLGAGDIDHHVQDKMKLKLSYDLSDAITARYTVGLFLDSTRTRIESYLRDAMGNPVYPASFNSGLYLRRQQHFAHAASFDGHSPSFDWQLAASLYDYAKDSQSSPTAALPAALTGGAGSVQRQDGTGWWTLDAKGTWKTTGADNTLSFGAHADRTQLRSQTYATADWRGEALGTRTAASLGTTQTYALWMQDAWRFVPDFTLTLGVRQEWWRASDGFNQTSATTPGLAQPMRTDTGFSPKATLEWRPAPAWRVKASFGQAYRFPTVGELYQATTVGTVLANPNPDLRPERARSAELAIEHRDARGSIRASLFNEVIDGALISQTAPVSVLQPNGTIITATASFVQNVDQTRVRGVEFAAERRDLVPGVDVSVSATYADAITSRNTVLPASVGKAIPGVPRWKANAVLTYRPDARVALTAAARYSGRSYGTLDNSDVVTDTYQGFDGFFVVDLRATFRATSHWMLGIGVDNVNNDRYFLFHPFPQRSVTVDLRWSL